jgi:hypothetical protein
MRLGNLIGDHCGALDERRGELFRLLHPNRDHFEKKGGRATTGPPLFNRLIRFNPQKPFGGVPLSFGIKESDLITTRAAPDGASLLAGYRL